MAALQNKSTHRPLSLGAMQLTFKSSPIQKKSPIDCVRKSLIPCCHFNYPLHNTLHDWNTWMHGDPDWGHIARRAGAPKTQSVIVSECQTTSLWQRPFLIPAHPWIKRYKNHSLFDIFPLTLINCRRRMHVLVSILDYPRHHFHFYKPSEKVVLRV